MKNATFKILQNDDKDTINNMYPRLYKDDMYYATVTYVHRKIVHQQFVGRDSLSIYTRDIVLFKDIDAAKRHVSNILHDVEIPSGDILHVTIKHIVRGMCRKCGRSERHKDNSVLCLPCSYT